MEAHKNCPVCNKIIQANSLRCEYCGSIFSSEQDTGSFSGFDQQVQNALSDRYKLKGIVGKGGMAIVYKAIQINQQNSVFIRQYSEFLPIVRWVFYTSR